MAPTAQAHEISAASRLNNVRYAIRDLACVADEVVAQGHKVLPLNVGDPLNFDFQTPPHIIEAVYKAMRDGKNGYAPSSGIKLALEAIRREAARKGITTVQDVFVTTGVSDPRLQVHTSNPVGSVQMPASALRPCSTSALPPAPDDSSSVLVASSRSPASLVPDCASTCAANTIAAIPPFMSHAPRP